MVVEIDERQFDLFIKSSQFDCVVGRQNVFLVTKTPRRKIMVTTNPIFSISSRLALLIDRGNVGHVYLWQSNSLSYIAVGAKTVKLVY